MQDTNGIITNATGDWLEEHIDTSTGYIIDNTLTVTNAAADAKKTGDEIGDLKSTIENALSSTIDFTGNPVVLENQTASDEASVSSTDGTTAYFTGTNLVNLPDISSGSSVVNPKNLCIPFTCYIDFDVSNDFVQSQSAWLIYAKWKDGTTRYISYNSNSDVKKLAATQSNPIVEFYARSSYVTAGGFSNIRVTLNRGDAYTSYHGKTAVLPASNVGLYDGTNYIWTDGSDCVVRKLQADGRIVSIENDIESIQSDIEDIEGNFESETVSTTIEVTSGTRAIGDITHDFKAGQRVSLLLSGTVGIISDATSAFFIDVTSVPNVYLPYTKYNVPVEYTFPTDATKIRCNIGNTRATGSGTVTFSITVLPVNTRLSNSENRLDSLESAVTPMNAEFTKYDLPDYYFTDNYIQNKITRINTLAKAAVGNGDAFVFITDEHWTQNAKKSPNLLRYIKNNCHIRNVFSGGDTGEGGSDAFCRLLSDSWKDGSVHHATGNHEYYSGGNNSNLYYMMDMQNNDEVGNPQSHYYYYDNVQAKIRYIILNSDGTSAWGDTQLAWFTSALNVESGWGIIIFVHWMYMVNWSTDAVTLGSSAPQGFVDAINNYSGNGEIIAVFQGHVHRDRITFTQTNGTPVIITTSDKYVRSESDGVYDIDVTRELGTITEQAFDVVIVNRSTKTINAVRIGGLARNGVGNDPGSKVEERTVTWN